MGIYGNADPLDPDQWLNIERIISKGNIYTGSMAWSDISSTCTGFPNGLNIKFLVAYAGEKQNPQNKIISASYSYTSIPWKMRYVTFCAKRLRLQLSKVVCILNQSVNHLVMCYNAMMCLPLGRVYSQSVSQSFSDVL